MSSPVRANKKTYDGIKFASGLEVYTYKALVKARIFEGYENETFVLLEPFKFYNTSFEKQANGKGGFKDRGNKKIQGIKYTPDFCGETYIIECKGRANDAFPLRYKLFKKHLIEENDNRNLYKPQSHADVDQMIELIINLK